VPDIEVLQDVPDELKSRTDTKGEASLRGHLKNDGDEKTGSQSYVPPDAKDDKALKMADDLLHGIKVNPSAAANGDKAANDTPAAASTDTDPVATRKPN
jgi:carboxyl-terminal processing protease